jgi:hypothetical protein
MKKGLLLLVIGVALLSCKRDYQCDCERENMGGFIQTDSFEFSTISKSRAEQVCTDPNWDKCTLTEL